MRTYWAVTDEDGKLMHGYITTDPVVRGLKESAEADANGMMNGNGVLEVAVVPAAALKRLVDRVAEVRDHTEVCIDGNGDMFSKVVTSVLDELFDALSEWKGGAE